MTTSQQVPNVRIGARGLFKHYGSIQANRDVTFSVGPAEIHAVVGENGAGKSTLMRILQGLEKPDAGSVIFNDREIVLSGPQQALDLAIGMVHQEFMIAPELTLLENYVLGAEPVRAGPLQVIDWKKAREDAEALANSVGVGIDWNRRAAVTPVHIQQYVEILRLLGRGSIVLILDEPTAVLAPQQVEILFGLLRQLKRQGRSIIFISHKLHEVRALADRVTIMRRGMVIASNPIEDTNIETMTRHIVGDSTGVPHPQTVEKPRSANLASLMKIAAVSAPSIEFSRPVEEVSFDLRSGEIVGLAGIAGNGQDELIECLCGLRRPSAGKISVGDSNLAGMENASFRSAGIGYVSPDRGREGLARSASIEDNVTAGSQRRPELMIGPIRNLKAVRGEARRRLGSLDVRYDGIGDPASSLSGGNQQKLVFAREISANPKILIVSQPTRGVDLNGIASIHGTLKRFRDEGGAVLLASEELDELIGLCDRILVMANGKIVGELSGKEATPESIGLLMLAGSDIRGAASA
jgi:general nucleoside transport system ATP-binding protein